MSRLPSSWKHALVGAIAAVLVFVLTAPQGLRAEDDSVVFANGQSLTNDYGFLRYWREHNGESALGIAISAPLQENGLTVQYFERARLELHPELDGSPVLLGRIGADYAQLLWRTFELPAANVTDDPNVQRFAETGHTLREPFRTFWHNNGGVETLGLPISEMTWEYIGDQMLEVQYFERARLERRSQVAGSTDEVVISNLGRDLALLRNVALTLPAAVVEQPAAAQAAPAAPVAPQVVEPARAAPAKPAVVQPKASKPQAKQPARVGRGGAKYIVVDLSQQHLYAYEGDTVVFETAVSTGRDGFNTPPGNFSVYAKLSKQTMSGTIGGEYYNVPNVPNVMYINGGVALHGTYWHNQFGIRRMSHGCINLPLKAASWLYGWAGMGTPVTVQR